MARTSSFSLSNSNLQLRENLWTYERWIAEKLDTGVNSIIMIDKKCYIMIFALFFVGRDEGERWKRVWYIEFSGRQWLENIDCYNF